MIIAQASDLHLRADPGHINNIQFRRVLDHLLMVDPLPDILILSGDLAHEGDAPSYANLKRGLEQWPRPVRLMPGNHDRPDALRTVFPDVADVAGHAQSTVELPGLRLILLDTTGPGREGGAFCEQRSRWLASELKGAGGDPVLLFMHHPPFALGIPWLDPGAHQSWTHTLADALEGARIAAICAGHVHMGATARWNGIPVIACPSTSSDTGLAFAAMDRTRPDGRVLAERGGLGFALHHWVRGELVTVFGRCPDAVLARWDESTRGLVDAMLAERED